MNATINDFVKEWSQHLMKAKNINRETINPSKEKQLISLIVSFHAAIGGALC